MVNLYYYEIRIRLYCNIFRSFKAEIACTVFCYKMSIIFFSYLYNHDYSRVYIIIMIRVKRFDVNFLIFKINCSGGGNK